eukprot:s4559_g3.t2
MAVMEREVLVEALREALLGAIEQKLEQHQAELLLALKGKAPHGNLQLEEMQMPCRQDLSPQTRSQPPSLTPSRCTVTGLQENIFAGEIGQVSASLGRSTSSWFDQSRKPAAEKIGKRVWDEPHREDVGSEEHLAILPLPARISVQPPDEDVPGLVPKAISRSACSEIPPGASPTVHSVQVVSQTQILGTDEEGASGILLRWAFLLKTLILLLFLSELVLTILVLQHGHVHGVAWDFTALAMGLVQSFVSRGMSIVAPQFTRQIKILQDAGSELLFATKNNAMVISDPALDAHCPRTVYFMVGYGGVVLLARALASEELNLVALKLQLHYGDERRTDMLETELLRRERWKYAFAWLAFMASVVVHQGFEVWNIQRGVLDDTILRTEDLPLAKVFAQVNEAITIISFGFVSAMILLTCYIQSVLLLAADGALDDWCLEVYDSQDYEVGVKTWNRMQALLKCLGRELETPTTLSVQTGILLKASGTVVLGIRLATETALAVIMMMMMITTMMIMTMHMKMMVMMMMMAASWILLQAFGGIGFVAYSASAVSVVIQASFESLSLSMIAGAGAPAIFLLMIAIRLGAQAAALTEKCRVLPAFVNTIPGACIDLHRQYLVKFIVDTSAGFIVKGVTLTQAMFLRQLYLLATTPLPVRSRNFLGARECLAMAHSDSDGILEPVPKTPKKKGMEPSTTPPKVKKSRKRSPSSEAETPAKRKRGRTSSPTVSRSTPAGAAPSTPRGAAPSTPRGAAPSTPRGAAPSTPRFATGAMPSTPRGAVPSTPRGAVPSTPRGRTAMSGSSRGGNAALAALPPPLPMTFAPAVPGLTSPEMQPPVRCGCKTCNKFVQRWYIHTKFGCFVARCDAWPQGCTSSS